MSGDRASVRDGHGRAHDGGTRGPGQAVPSCPRHARGLDALALSRARAGGARRAARLPDLPAGPDLVLEYTQAQVSGGEPTRSWASANYAELFGDQQFWTVLRPTVLFAAACVVGTLAVGARSPCCSPGSGLVPRLLLMLAALGAWATPAITGSTVWVFLFDADFGPGQQRCSGSTDFSWTYGRYSAFALVAARWSGARSRSSW